MRTDVLEKTVTDLQLRVGEIEKRLEEKADTGWRKIAGAAREDQHFAEAMRLGAEWRGKANREKW